MATSQKVYCQAITIPRGRLFVKIIPNVRATVQTWWVSISLKSGRCVYPSSENKCPVNMPRKDKHSKCRFTGQGVKGKFYMLL